MIYQGVCEFVRTVLMHHTMYKKEKRKKKEVLQVAHLHKILLEFLKAQKTSNDKVIWGISNGI